MYYFCFDLQLFLFPGKDDRVPAEEVPSINNNKDSNTEEISFQKTHEAVSCDSNESEDMQPWRGQGNQSPHGNSQRGRLNQNYYNAREERLMQNRDGFHGGFPCYDRRQVGYDPRQHQQYQGNSRYYYDNRGGYGRPPSGNRYREDFLLGDRQRYNGQSHHEMSRSHSYDYGQKAYEPRNTNDNRNYDHFDKYNAKGRTEINKEPKIEVKDKTDNDKIKECTSSNKKPEEVTKKSDNSSDINPQTGFNVYQSEAYFSAGGAPETVRDSKVSTPVRNLKKLSPRGNRVSPKISAVRRQESAPSNLVTIPLQDKMEVSANQSPSSNLVSIPLADNTKDDSNASSEPNMVTVQNHDKFKTVGHSSNLVSISLTDKIEENSTKSSNLVSIPLQGNNSEIDNKAEKKTSPTTEPMPIGPAASSSNHPVSVPVQEMEIANSFPSQMCTVNKTISSTEYNDGQDIMDVTSNHQMERETVPSSSQINKPDVCGGSLKNDVSDKSVKIDDHDLGSPKLKLDVINTDKMDFSTLKRALNEVRTKDLGLTRKTSANESSTTVTSPSYKPSGQETLDKLSPKPTDHSRQRSAFNIMTLHEQHTQISPISKPTGPEIQPDLITTSPNSAFSPLGRKRSQSGEQKTPKLASPGFRHFVDDSQTDQDKTLQDSSSSKLSLSNVLSATPRKLSESSEKRTVKLDAQDHTPVKTAWNPSESDTEVSVSSSVASKFEASLKSASSYAEWKKIKAEQEIAKKKEKEKNRSCLEMANTPEEYRKLLKMQGKKSKEKDKQNSQSENQSADQESISEEQDMDHHPVTQNIQNTFTAIPDHDSGKSILLFIVWF